MCCRGRGRVGREGGKERAEWVGVARRVGERAERMRGERKRGNEGWTARRKHECTKPGHSLFPKQ